MTKGPSCLDCGTRLSQEPWAPELCPRCSLQLALEQSPVDVDVGDDPEALPTRQFPDQTFSSGQILGSRFQIRSLLGRGGMGEVWRAYDLKLRVDVALKTLRAELLEKERALQALRQEVRSAREVMSPNVCRVFDLVELDGQELVSMEYIDGTTLVTVLNTRGPLELPEAREIASQFLAGLEAIHQAGLVHRDLKPENLMITRSGRVVVMDFGIAKGLADRKTGTVSGTPAYMAPEQAKGEEVDARADVFSAGVVLSEMVAPSGIQTHTQREAIWKGIHHEPPEIPDSPWAPVLKKSVSRLAEHRHASASALARALEEVTLQVDGADDVHPYPGLASFTEEDAEYFFGRELEVEAMWKKLRRPHLLGLIGPSGAGKSSFLRAGLLPVMPEGWRAVICQPGTAPFQNLARSLMPEFSGDMETMQELLNIEKLDTALAISKRWRQQHTEVLVIVDQFEELFTLNPPESQSRFAELLGMMSVDADVRVLLSMRDDFFLHCHKHRSLAPMFSEPTPLHAPTGAALRRALVQPALKCGYRFEEEALVEEMITEVSEERGALPLLAFAAAQLWDRRDRGNGLLTREAYEQIGGVGGSLAQHAETTLEKVGSDRVPIVREIFRNLVTAQGTRAARNVEELLSVFEDKGAAKDVLRGLIDARLLTSFEVTAAEEEEATTRVEIIHESLLTAWPRLVRWQTQDQEGAQLRDELRQAAQMWEQRGRSADRLWTGTAVKEFQIWRERYSGGLTSTEAAFAGAMVQHAERRRRRRRFAIAASFGVLLGIVVLVGALWQRSEAAREDAVNEARRAEASKLLALGQLELERYPTGAVAYALESLELSDTHDARVFALKALQKGPTATILSMSDVANSGAYAYRLDFSSDDEWLAISGHEVVQLRSRDGAQPILLPKYATSDNMPVRIKFSPEGDRLLTLEQGDLRFWSVPGFKELGRQPIEPGPSGLYSFIKGFYTCTTVGNEEVVRAGTFEGEEPRLVGRMKALGPSDIDRAGKWLAHSIGRRLFMRSLEDWSLPPHLAGEHPNRIRGVRFHPNGETIAALDRSGEIRFWSMEASNEPERVLPAKGARGIAFDKVGTRLAAFGLADERSEIRYWDLKRLPESEAVFLQAPEPVIQDATFDPSGRWLVTSHNTAVMFWPVERDYPLVLRRHEGWIGLAFTPDGKHLVSAGRREVRVRPLDGSERSRVVLRDNFIAPRISVDPKGRFIFVTGGWGKAIIVPLDGGPTRRLEGFSSSSYVLPCAIDPSGRFAAAAPWRSSKEEKVIRIWDLESGESRVLGPAQDAGDMDQGGYSGLAFLADGRLVSNGKSGLYVWNLADGSASLLSVDAYGGVALSPDGRYVLHSRSISPSEELRELVMTDIVEGKSRILPSHGTSPLSATFDPKGAFAVTGGGLDGVVRVGPVTGGEPYLFLGHEGRITGLAVSPHGRWIASGGTDGTVRLWPMPDGPPFHTLSYEELLARLRALTNLRAVENESSSTGYRLEVGPFPGWQTVPTW